MSPLRRRQFCILGMGVMALALWMANSWELHPDYFSPDGALGISATFFIGGFLGALSGYVPEEVHANHLWGLDDSPIDSLAVLSVAAAYRRNWLKSVESAEVFFGLMLVADIVFLGGTKFGHALLVGAVLSYSIATASHRPIA